MFIENFIKSFNNFNSNLLRIFVNINDQPLQPQTLVQRSTQGITTQSLNDYVSNHSHELPNDYRFQKTQSPIFRYDFKVGHYMTESVKTLNRHLFVTLNDVTGGIRMAPWFFSDKFRLHFKVDALAYLTYFSNSFFDEDLREFRMSIIKGIFDDFKDNEAYLAYASFTSGFYNLFNSFSNNSSFINVR